MSFDLMNHTSPQTNTRTAIRASLACVQCRSRHLRCDGLKPTCSRCRDDDGICTYTKSRRGGRRRAQAEPMVAQREVSATESAPDSVHSTQAQNTNAATPIAGLVGNHNSLASDPSPHSGSHFDAWDDETSISQRLIKLYYHFFHYAHPCVLPSRYIEAYRLSSSPGVELLTSVMCYIGSLYTQRVDSEPWRGQVEVSLREMPPQSSLFEVQALLLYSIAAQWSDYRAYADTLINLAIDRALALGMNDVGFATKTATQQSVYAESCRRTWWSLYLTEISMAAIERKQTMRLSIRLIAPTVELPCSEEDYESGSIPQPRTLDEWDQREFADEADCEFSSFSYQIGIYRTIDFCLFGKARDSEESVKRITTCADAGVVAFRSFCAQTKRRLIRENGTFDSFIFKANMGIIVYTAEVHRFLSTIQYDPIEAISSCGPPPPPEKLAPAFIQEAPTHTAKILQATELLADLLTLPISLLQQSPMTVCQIATPTIALISACKHVLNGEDRVAARERIRVGIAAVEKFAEVWPRAARTAKEIKTVAREIFGINRASTLPNTSAPPSNVAQQYCPSTSADGYQGFAFLESLMGSTSYMGYASSADLPASSAADLNSELGINVTTAY